MTSRRDFIRGLAALTGASAGNVLYNPRALAQSSEDPRFLIVLCATGGGSIVDGPMAIRASESANPDTINTFPDALVTGWDGSPFRAVDLSGDDIGPIPASFEVAPSSFFARRRHEMMVTTWTRTSVNHAIGQKRSVTGNEAWRGRTLQEIVAWQYGLNAPIPNVNLLAGTGYGDPGTDASVPLFARGQLVSNPAVWPLSLDGARGQTHAVSPEVLAAIRKTRNDRFEPATAFDNVMRNAPRLLEWKELRGTPQQRIEGLDLINKLLIPAGGVALEDFGLQPSPAAADVLAAFPDLAVDPLHAKAALAFLLLKYRVSVTVTLGPSADFVYDDRTAYGEGNSILPLNSVLNPPLAFDSCHQGHRTGQAVVWDRLYKVIDGLITLLSAEDYGDGTSMWDRTMIYVASDFGREKHRPAGASDWPTGHDLNNGVMVFSPLVPGDTLLGGVNPDTGKTFGFDPQTGAPEPGREMAEAEIFSGLLGALGADTTGSGLPDMPTMRKG
jgi:hypothetical protein